MQTKYEKCPYKKCLANFDGYCQQSVLKCFARENGLVIHEEYNKYWESKSKNK